nr:protein kinase-like domain, phloem protein 2-like protein [Tanacetum cinerariifolium]
RGFLIDNGQKVFAVDKHGKKCLMLSARSTLVIYDKNSTWKSLPESSDKDNSHGNPYLSRLIKSMQ